jgi:hypothetical protein
MPAGPSCGAGMRAARPESKSVDGACSAAGEPPESSVGFSGACGAAGEPQVKTPLWSWPSRGTGKTAACYDQEEQLEVLPGRRLLGVLPSLAGEDVVVVADVWSRHSRRLTPGHVEPPVRRWRNRRCRRGSLGAPARLPCAVIRRRAARGCQIEAPSA